MTRILALDLATICGYAHSDDVLFSGAQSFTPRRGDSPGMRWITFRGWLRKLLENSPADIIVYEQAHHRGGAPTHVAHSFIAVVEMVASEKGIETTSRHSSAIKKHASGKGNAGKTEMIKLAKEKWGDIIVDDNHADALWLLDLVKCEML